MYRRRFCLYVNSVHDNFCTKKICFITYVVTGQLNMEKVIVKYQNTHRRLEIIIAIGLYGAIASPPKDFVHFNIYLHNYKCTISKEMTFVILICYKTTSTYTSKY